MEGTVLVTITESPPRTELGGTREEVNKINEFTFDLQRFDLSETQDTSKHVFSVTTSSGIKYGEASDFTTENLSGATSIQLLKTSANKAQTITIATGVCISSTCTLDLNGNTLSYTGTESAIKISENGSVTINNSGTVTVSGASAVGIEVANGTLNMTKGYIYNKGTSSTALKVTSGTVTLGTEGATTGPTVGSTGTDGTGLLQEDGTVTVNYATIQGKKLGAQIDAGTFTVKNAMSIKNLTKDTAALQINGAGVTATIEKGGIGNSLSSTYANNAITIIDNTDASKTASTVKISGGNIYSNGNAIQNNDSNVTVYLSGVNLQNNGKISGSGKFACSESDTTVYSASINDITRTFANKSDLDNAIADSAVYAKITENNETRYYTNLNTASEHARTESKEITYTETGKSNAWCSITVGETIYYYASLSAANTALGTEGGTIKIENDITSANALLSVALAAEGATKTLTLDLDGHTITRTGNGHVIELGSSYANRKGKVTLNIINSSETAAAIKNTNTTADQGNGITVWHDQILYVGTASDGTKSNGKITISAAGNQGAIMGNGSVATTASGADGQNTIINITGDVELEGSIGIYHPQPGGKLTIQADENGKAPVITGRSGAGIEIRAGELTVNGGTIKSKAESYTCNANGNGTTTNGAGIAVSQHTTKKNITVTVNDGDISGVVGVSVSNPQGNLADQGSLSVNIKGGTVTGSSGTPIASANADSRVTIKIDGGTFKGNLDTASGTALTNASLSTVYVARDCGQFILTREE